MNFVDVDERGAATDEHGVPFEEALGSLIRQAEREGVEVAAPRDVDAIGEGTWTVEITKVDPGGGRERIEPADLSLDGFTVEYGGPTDEPPDVDVPAPLLRAAMGYIDAAVEQARDAVGDDSVGFDITVDSDIPLGAGLGSSAAVVVAGIDAATRELGVELSARDVADRAYVMRSSSRRAASSENR